MLGVALPGIAPTGPVPGAGVGAGGGKQTMLGVAMPGIAPTHDVPPGVPPAQAPAAQPYVAPGPAPQVAERPVAPIYRRPAFIVVLAGLFLAVVVLLFAVFWPTHSPIERVEVSTDEAGHDVISLSCASCPDGTVLKIQDASCKTNKHEGSIVLSNRLRVGDNRLEVQIDRPESGRDENVEVLLPVLFRVRPNLSGLASAQPYVTVQVVTNAQAKVTVDGKPMKLDKDGKAERKLDISEKCVGQRSDIAKVQFQVPYVIELPDGSKHEGTVKIGAGITPLMVFTPRPHMITDQGQVQLVGVSAPGAQIEFASEKIVADKDGVFSRTLKIDQPGALKLTVRSSGKGMATRTAQLEITRVSSLADTMTSWRRDEHLETKQVFSENEKVGQRVILTGYIAEVDTSRRTKVFLVDSGGACDQPPCLVKVATCAGTRGKKGSYVQVLGYLAEMLTVSGRRVPVVDAALVVEGKKGRR
jgi:hypothetical protein